MKNTFDVIVVGGGHAGAEAAYAAARMGSKTALITLDPNTIASAPCNPSIGGLGKGHIVFEIGAFDGLMPKLCSHAYLQARMLNTSKGPAVQGLRIQIDKYAYSNHAFTILSSVPNLTIIPGMATTLNTTQTTRKAVTGVTCADGQILYAPTVIITSGTFLNGIIHIGRARYPAGQRAQKTVPFLAESIAQAMEIPIMRLKTGTPPRLLQSSLDYAKFTKQPSDLLDYLYEFDNQEVQEHVPCYVTHTNEKTHEIIRKNLHLSALYSGNIKGTGPRYCPSIEDKIGRYPDRDNHHVFIEPEGLNIPEIYPAGISTSLPLDVQYAYTRTISGFENAIITKCGYAIEYDAFQPNNLTLSLEAKQVDGLFLAGQVNGTTGYEEAAGQGLLAGINAHLKHTGQSPFTLSRTESYIGVMVDDLVTIGVDEPYRMFTSRAERRLLLRQDNVFIRLSKYAQRYNLLEQAAYEKRQAEEHCITKSLELIKKNKNSNLFKLFFSIDFTQAIQKACKAALIEAYQEKGLTLNPPSSRALLCMHAEIRYEGYIEKERLEAEKSHRYQEMMLPEELDVKKIPGLSRELQNKMLYHKPKTIAQAQLIPGMTPAAISILIFQTKMKYKETTL